MPNHRLGNPYSGRDTMQYGGYDPTGNAEDTPENWRMRMERDRAQRGGQPSYGGGYFGDSGRGGQSFNGAQRVYPGDPGYRAHPTRPQGYAGTRAGKPQGPRNYQRADDRVLGDVCERLALNPDLDASDLTVHMANGVVTLGGTVTDRRQKRLAEESAADVYGVMDVENRIRVGAAGSDPSERTLNLS
ncbi:MULTISPECIES: BON domain-containing protein [unclassified Cupriavidus]|uniref:BON domain-containing protein n=1 Tax=Cupriavidus sp. H19C3 TaxID=3241603 RepID=UPI003BF8B6B4